MITKKTFATMIVPSIAPTWTKAARGANSSVAPHAASVVRPSTSAPRTSSFRTTRQSTS